MPVLIAAGHVILFPESGTFFAVLVPFSSQCLVLSPNHALIEGNLGQFIEYKARIRVFFIWKVNILGSVLVVRLLALTSFC